MDMTLPRRRLPCYPDSILVYAVAGTGSNLDLMKEDYAIDRGFQIEKVSRHERFVRLPGDKIAQITGKVRPRFDTVFPLASDMSGPMTHTFEHLMSAHQRRHSDDRESELFKCG
jgi:hypothetical protein